MTWKKGQLSLRFADRDAAIFSLFFFVLFRLERGRCCRFAEIFDAEIMPFVSYCRSGIAWNERCAMCEDVK